jgi:hypothetical protein
MSRIISFRGLMADGAQERISLETIRGVKGYKITKFELIMQEPGQVNVEHTVKIYKVLQTSIDNTIDFSDNTLIGASYYTEGSSDIYPGFITIVFDNEIFNQDIYITHSDVGGTAAVNYYIELEQMDLNMDEATVATLKNIRNND